MAVLDMEAVAGGRSLRPAPMAGASAAAWSEMQRSLDDVAVTGVAVRPLLDRPVFEVATPQGIQLYEARDGKRVLIDAAMARRIALAGYSGTGPIKHVSLLTRPELAIREHQPPAWRVDFDDRSNSSFYVSQATGALLERRNDSWRAWDFFWMLHTMDYAKRTSFNHPLIVTAAFGVLWLAISGVYLLFKADSTSRRRSRRGRRPGSI